MQQRLLKFNEDFAHVPEVVLMESTLCVSLQRSANPDYGFAVHSTYACECMDYAIH